MADPKGAATAPPTGPFLGIADGDTVPGMQQALAGKRQLIEPELTIEYRDGKCWLADFVGLDDESWVRAKRAIDDVISTQDRSRTQVVEGDRRPHSRACGITPHEHGLRCSSDCPTCGAKATG